MKPVVGMKVRNIQPSGKPGRTFREVAADMDALVVLLAPTGERYRITRRDFDRYWLPCGEYRRPAEPTCGECEDFLGFGDWGLSCKSSYHTLCDSDTPACERFRRQRLGFAATCEGEPKGVLE